jgi:hypothetical protein
VRSVSFQAAAQVPPPQPPPDRGIPTNGAGQSLEMTILPPRAWRGRVVTDSHHSNAPEVCRARELPDRRSTRPSDNRSLFRNANIAPSSIIPERCRHAGLVFARDNLVMLAGEYAANRTATAKGHQSGRSLWAHSTGLLRLIAALFLACDESAFVHRNRTTTPAWATS